MTDWTKILLYFVLLILGKIQKQNETFKHFLSLPTMSDLKISWFHFEGNHYVSFWLSIFVCLFCRSENRSIEEKNWFSKPWKKSFSIIKTQLTVNFDIELVRAISMTFDFDIWRHFDEKFIRKTYATSERKPSFDIRKLSQQFSESNRFFFRRNRFDCK